MKSSSLTLPLAERVLLSQRLFKWRIKFTTRGLCESHLTCPRFLFLSLISFDWFFFFFFAAVMVGVCSLWPDQKQVKDHLSAVGSVRFEAFWWALTCIFSVTRANQIAPGWVWQNKSHLKAKCQNSDKNCKWIRSLSSFLTFWNILFVFPVKRVSAFQQVNLSSDFKTVDGLFWC